MTTFDNMRCALNSHSSCFTGPGRFGSDDISADGEGGVALTTGSGAHLCMSNTAVSVASDCLGAGLAQLMLYADGGGADDGYALRSSDPALGCVGVADRSIV